MYKVDEVAATLKIGKNTVYDLVDSGKLRCYRLGVKRSMIRFSEEHVAAYLASVETRQVPERQAVTPRLNGSDLRRLGLD